MRHLTAALVCIVVAVVICVLFMTLPAFAHDIWISKEHRTNDAGEWCCNGFDCKVVESGDYLVSPRGYTMTADGEFIPHAETQASGDNQFWICRRPDKSRRCTFAPSGGT